MSWLRERLDGILDLGPRDDPRRIAVGARRARVERALVSTIGARARIGRSADAPENDLALVWCVRSGVPVEIVEGDRALRVDGRIVSIDRFRAAVLTAGR